MISEIDTSKKPVSSNGWVRDLNSAYSKNFALPSFRSLFEPLNSLSLKKLKEHIGKDLLKTFGITFCPYRDLSSIPDDEFLSRAHALADEKYASTEAAVSLLEKSPQHGFHCDLRYDDPRTTIHQYLDFRVNRVVMGFILDSYKAFLRDSTSLATLADYKNYLLTNDHENQLAEKCAELIRQSAANRKPIYLIDIGGGTGELDKKILAEFQRGLPDQKLFLVNVCPYIDESDFVLPKSEGVLIRKEPFTERTETAQKLEEIIPEEANRVVLCSRTLHHTRYSPGVLKALTEDIFHADATLLVEHPVHRRNITNLADKVLYLADEFVANRAIFGELDWFKSADDFVVQLFPSKTLRAHSDRDVPALPNTHIYLLKNERLNSLFYG